MTDYSWDSNSSSLVQNALLCCVSQDKLSHMTPSLRGSGSSQGRLDAEAPRGGLGASAERT